VVVADITYQGAVDLVISVTDPDQLARLLSRRSHARLMAMSGAPIAVTASHGRTPQTARFS
jgi:hypothetical protein